MRRLLFALPLFALIVSAGFALTASNTVPDNDVDNTASPQGTPQATPTECNGYAITARIASTNVSITGTGSNEFIMGGNLGQSINGAGGNDCIFGGGGNDTIDGGLGSNRIDGGPGTDTCLNAATKVSCEL